MFGISRHSPPKDILEQFLNYMPDSEKSMTLAHKLQCHQFIIKHFITQKDRLALIGYKARIAPHEQEYFLIETALQSSVSVVLRLFLQLFIVSLSYKICMF